MRKLMGLAFIPAAHILRMFLQISSTADDDRLSALASYVYTNWIESFIWPPSAWGVFMQNICTNNDVERWHHRINNTAGRGQIQVYLLIDLLHEEAKFLEVQVSLLRNDQYSRSQRKEYQRVNEMICKLWDTFRARNLTIFTPQPLKAVGVLFSPMVSGWAGRRWEKFFLAVSLKP